MTEPLKILESARYWDRITVRDMRKQASSLEARAKRLRAEADEIEHNLNCGPRVPFAHD